MTKAMMDQKEHQEHQFQDYKDQKGTQVILALFLLTIFENVPLTTFSEVLIRVSEQIIT